MNKYTRRVGLGLEAGIISGIVNYLFILFLSELTSKDMGFLSIFLIIPVVFYLFDIKSFIVMSKGYYSYIIGYIISLFLLIDAGIISNSGYVYIGASILLILGKLYGDINERK